ncbi:hypothetical protein MYSTI_06829 [Myxococcus stipitatus DSM 14675]|uniref:Uncharacterized protein n=1 Tax=Myxococcus stipitatus (strain DSM 14675 / JCM 12634 / Mx s8) TaxID=1278073 RepID=L7UKN5_MYXSD|nr:hypothetical protein [Myxococcus stipitatus]AGC48102.1 hypothetical protein MYSTI_06829 [Myxococcus stipitatus DSM 14675]
MRRTRDAIWGGLGVLLLPSGVHAEVADKQLFPWEPAPVLATLVMCGVCLALALPRRGRLWMVAGGLSGVWALFWLQLNLLSSEVGPMLAAELSAQDAAAFRGGVVIQALAPLLMTLIGPWRRRGHPRSA